MHRIWIAIFAMVAVFALGLNLPTARADSSTATTQPAPERMAKLKTAFSQLDLTAGQKEKVRTIMKDVKAKLENLKSSAAAGTVDKTEVRAVVKEGVEKMMKVLTEEQKAKLKENLKAEKAESTTQP